VRCYAASYGTPSTAALKPGLTGLRQGPGRSGITHGERVQLDPRYAPHASLQFDVRIDLRTVSVITWVPAARNDERRGAVLLYAWPYGTLAAAAVKRKLTRVRMCLGLNELANG
jgi:hypothetical protein